MYPWKIARVSGAAEGKMNSSNGRMIRDVSFIDPMPLPRPSTTQVQMINGT